MKVKHILAILGMLGALISSEYKAHALLISLNNTGQSATFLYDGATSSPSCTLCDASVTLTYTGTTLNIAFSNTSGDGTAPSPMNILTLFAFNTTPDLTFSNPIFSGLPSGKAWSFQTNGLGSFEFGGSSDNGINDGLDAGESGNLSLTITNSGLTSFGVDVTQTHFQAINQLGGTSTKPNGCLSGGTQVCTGDDGGTGQSVPEPSTIILLGSGLMVLARAARRKLN